MPCWRIAPLFALVGLLTLLPTAEAASQLDDAYQVFYTGRYEDSAAMALDIRTADPDNIAASELRSSALHFQLKRLFGEPADKNRAWKACAACQELMTAFMAETTHGLDAARARLQASPSDLEALFLLGKLNLNYVWLQLGTVGRKTGWGEYWEARRSLDAVLKQNPMHVRARTARAWIDYIVDTKVPWAIRFALGGANKERGMRSLHDAARTDGDFFAQTEASFALWEMQVREKNLTDAVIIARGLSRDFPDNRELAKFLTTHDVTTTVTR